MHPSVTKYSLPNDRTYLMIVLSFTHTLGAREKCNIRERAGREGTAEHHVPETQG